MITCRICKREVGETDLIGRHCGRCDKLIGEAALQIEAELEG